MRECSLPALSPSSNPATPLQFTTLPNGLTVASRDNHGAVASVGVYVKAGSRYEEGTSPVCPPAVVGVVRCCSAFPSPVCRVSPSTSLRDVGETSMLWVSVHISSSPWVWVQCSARRTS
jgi:hypothetical protein